MPAVAAESFDPRDDAPIGATAVAYQWRDAARIKVDANAAAKLFNDIANRRGTVSPELVVDASRPADAPLHEHFEWDDSAAAEAHRETQARLLIRSLVTVYVRNDTEDPLPPVRALVKLKPIVDSSQAAHTQPNEYTPMKTVVNTGELRFHRLRQAAEALKQWADTYGDMVEFAQVARIAERLYDTHR